VITRGGKPVAKLVPVERPGERPLGAWAGQVKMTDDFDKTPEWLIEEFYK
jgi:antitoxin (DNA-binding transcriptional repressor) of toxin-antitoxin stability system